MEILDRIDWASVNWLYVAVLRCQPAKAAGPKPAQRRTRMIGDLRLPIEVLPLQIYEGRGQVALVGKPLAEGLPFPNEGLM